MIDISFEEIIYKSRKKLFSFGYGVENSPLYGDGEEFAEIGEYSGGDIRHLNYKATAKSGTPKINLYHDKRRVDVTILYTASASMLGGDVRSKHSLAIEIITSLSYSANNRGDRVSALIYSDDDSQYISGYKGDKLAKIVYDRLKNINLYGKRATLKKAFDEVSAILKKRSLIFVISDFFEMADIEMLSYKNEVILIQIREEAEEYPASLNGNILINPFDNSSIYSDIDKSMLKRYQNELRAIDRFWQEKAKQEDIIFAPLYTSSNPYPILKKALELGRYRV